MTIQEAKHKAHVQQWANQWREQVSSGQDCKTWCEQHNISYSTFRCHIKAVRESVLEDPKVDAALSATPLTPCETTVIPKIELSQVHLDSGRPQGSFRQSDIHIELRGMAIDINNSADREHMTYILGVLLNVK